MCLGDLRFNRWIANRTVNVTLTANYASILPANRLRVGLFLGVGQSDGFWWLGEQPTTAASGIQIDTGTSTGYYLSYQQHGTWVQGELFGRLTANGNAVLIEQTIPAALYDELFTLGLRGGNQNNNLIF